MIMFLGTATLLAMCGTFALADRVLGQSAGAGTPDAAAVGIVGILGAFTTTGLGFLGGVLASTRSLPDKSEIDAALAPLTAGGAPLPVTVQNDEQQPVPTADVGAMPASPLPPGVVPPPD